MIRAPTKAKPLARRTRAAIYVRWPDEGLPKLKKYAAMQKVGLPEAVRQLATEALRRKFCMSKIDGRGGLKA